ncbi:hypothetical protein N0V90_012422 [Kalmusia sp. IMI 367209]|nr:hypothetical protein N0V90_012422 [Kalmusia sp. IMI 367209]
MTTTASNDIQSSSNVEERKKENTRAVDSWSKRKFSSVRSFFKDGRQRPAVSENQSQEKVSADSKTVDHVEELFLQIASNSLLDTLHGNKIPTSTLSPSIAFFVSELSEVEVERDASYPVPFVLLHGELLDAFAQARILEHNKSRRVKWCKGCAQHAEDVTIVVGVLDVEHLPDRPFVPLPFLKKHLEIKDVDDEATTSRGVMWGSIPEKAIRGILPWSGVMSGIIAKECFPPLLEDPGRLLNLGPYADRPELQALLKPAHLRRYWLTKSVRSDLSPERIFLALWNQFSFDIEEECTKQLAVALYGWTKGHFEVQVDDQQSWIIRNEIDNVYSIWAEWQDNRSTCHREPYDMSQVALRRYEIYVQPQHRKPSAQYVDERTFSENQRRPPIKAVLDQDKAKWIFDENKAENMKIPAVNSCWTLTNDSQDQSQRIDSPQRSFSEKSDRSEGTETNLISKSGENTMTSKIPRPPPIALTLLPRRIVQTSQPSQKSKIQGPSNSKVR